MFKNIKGLFSVNDTVSALVHEFREIKDELKDMNIYLSDIQDGIEKVDLDRLASIVENNALILIKLQEAVNEAKGLGCMSRVLTQCCKDKEGCIS